MNHHIELYPNIFTLEWCNNLINKFKHHSFLGVNYSIILSDLDPKLHTEFINVLLEKIYPKYIKKYPVLNNMNLGMFNETKLHQYRPQKETVPEGCENHGWHPYRCIAFNLYLNNIKKGGEDIFPNQNISIKPLQGGVVVFPAGYTHTNKSNIPIEKDKYILKSWIEFHQN
jgi:hypothetical protein